MTHDWGTDMDTFLEWRKANLQVLKGNGYRGEKKDMDLGHERYSRVLGTFVPTFDPEPGIDAQLFR